MIKINQPIIVEGKYDKITLENIVDATIITTDGYRIFKDRQKCDLIRTMAEKTGIIVVTDSDSAGAVIRSHIKQICPKGSICNVYIPQLTGKEKRKSKPSKQGFLGVEGLDCKTITDAFARSGITDIQFDEKTVAKVTKTDLYNLKLSGCKNSSDLRADVCEHLKLPKNLSSNAFLDCVNALFEREHFLRTVKL